MLTAGPSLLLWYWIAARWIGLRTTPLSSSETSCGRLFLVKWCRRLFPLRHHLPHPSSNLNRQHLRRQTNLLLLDLVVLSKPGWLGDLRLRRIKLCLDNWLSDILLFYHVCFYGFDHASCASSSHRQRLRHVRNIRRVAGFGHLSCRDNVGMDLSV